VVVPLSEGEIPAGLAGLVLDEVGHQVRTHADVGPPVAAHLVVENIVSTCDPANTHTPTCVRFGLFKRNVLIYIRLI